VSFGFRLPVRHRHRLWTRAFRILLKFLCEIVVKYLHVKPKFHVLKVLWSGYANKQAIPVPDCTASGKMLKKVKTLDMHEREEREPLSTS